MPSSHEPGDRGGPGDRRSAKGITVAVRDLAARLGVADAEIEVVSVEEVTWPDSSLGCPRQGMRYLQVLVNGSRIVLRAGGRTYEYHSGGGREPFYCPSPQPPVPRTGGSAAGAT